MDRRLFLLLALLLLLLPAVAEAQSGAGTYDIPYWSVDGGSTTSETTGNYTLGATIGQPDAGLFIVNGYRLVGGFWRGEKAGVGGERIYLPLIVRRTP